MDKIYDATPESISNIYYTIRRKVVKVYDFFRYDIMYFIQRGKRGYSDRDIWGFDHYLAEVIPKGVRHLAKIHHGCPTDLFKCLYPNAEPSKCDECKAEHSGKCQACAAWMEVLDQIATGFENYKSVVLDDEPLDELFKGRTTEFKNHTIVTTPEVTKEEWEQHRELQDKAVEHFNNVTMPLFAKYFGNLWD